MGNNWAYSPTHRLLFIIFWLQTWLLEWEGEVEEKKWQSIHMTILSF